MLPFKRWIVSNDGEETMLHALRATAFVAMVMAMSGGFASAQQGPPQFVRGQITAADDTSVTVKTREGPTVKLALAKDVRVQGIVKADPAGVAKGAYIGVASEPDAAGKLSAKEVHIFPEPMRGTAEGHRKWDLTPKSMMTNATVDAFKDRMVTLKYKDGDKTGEQMISVPANTPIVTYVPGDKTLLKAGAHVFAAAQKGADGSMTALRLAVGKDGVVPPM
jgi:hypothetical protein